MVKVGVSARMMSRSPEACGVGGKSIQYLEQNMANSIARNGGLPFLIPSIGTKADLLSAQFQPRAFAEALDALVLQGGIDICPETYRSNSLNPSIVGDPLRDRYELALINAFLELKKPILGVCRGMQLINVYMGGTLIQDIPTEIKTDICHLDEGHREHVHHDIQFTPRGYFASLYGPNFHSVSSIHHQCIKRLGNNLAVEAICPTDQIIEAIRYTGDSYMVGLQFHPEFHHHNPDEALDADIVFADFIASAHKRKSSAA